MVSQSNIDSSSISTNTSVNTKAESSKSTEEQKQLTTSKSIVENYNVDDNVFIIKDDGTLIGPKNDVDIFAVAKKFYSLYPDKTNYDFITIFSTFRDTSRTSGELHTNMINNVKGISFQEIKTSAYGLPNKLLGISFASDSYTSSHIKTEKDIINNFWILNHETGHQWLAYLGVAEGISTGEHYSNWFDTGFIKNGEQWSDVMGGYPWKQNSDGTWNVAPIIHQGFSPLSMYLMGFIPASDVPDMRIIVPQNPNDSTTQNVSATAKTISIQTIIQNYGERIPSYKDSQKDFKMAYILLVKKGEIPAQYQINNINLIAKNFPAEWNTITNGKSRINPK